MFSGSCHRRQNTAIVISGTAGLWPNHKPGSQIVGANSPGHYGTWSIFKRQHVNTQNLSDVCVLTAPGTSWFQHWTMPLFPVSLPSWVFINSYGRIEIKTTAYQTLGLKKVWSSDRHTIPLVNSWGDFKMR